MRAVCGAYMADAFHLWLFKSPRLDGSVVPSLRSITMPANREAFLKDNEATGDDYFILESLPSRGFLAADCSAMDR